MEKRKKNIKLIPFRCKLLLNLMLISLLFFVNGCNNCDNGNGPDSGESDLGLYFTALPLNSSTPTVYRIDPNAEELELVIDNAIIYSAPSDNGLIAFIRRSESVNDLMLFDIKNGETTTIESDNEQFSIAYPVISSDGNKIAFFGGNSRLFVYRLDNFSIEKITSNFYDNSLPSFSPNGKIICFVEYINDSKFKLIFLDAFQTENKITEFLFDGAFANNIQEINIKWQDDTKAIFGYVSNEVDKIAIVDLLQNQVEELEFEKELPGAAMPDLSDTGDMVCFISSNGELLARNIEGEPRFSTLTNNTNIRYSFPDWSPEGNYIIVNRNYVSEQNSSNSDIVVLKIVKNGVFAIAEENILISNNSYRAFWKID